MSGLWSERGRGAKSASHAHSIACDVHAPSTLAGESQTIDRITPEERPARQFVTSAGATKAPGGMLLSIPCPGGVDDDGWVLQVSGKPREWGYPAEAYRGPLPA